MMDQTKAIDFSIARQFSRTPGPRRPEEGKHSGEELRDVLEPLLLQAEQEGKFLIVDLDGAAGYATSFLEAVFGGLSRKLGADRVLKIVRIKSDEEPHLKDEIEFNIKSASAEQ